ncbi:DUF397 domain-containing protein [Streptomyces sp. NPDC002599]|uniref:DUF397 domain-containing protein n=1 Tax=Streptomyces sp. NPDC002599 TaxID=3154421 RepID=UPI0033309CE9
MSEKPNWRTSTYTSQDSCVEVADNKPQTVMVRDTKNRNYGVVAVASEAWTAFVQGIKHRPAV